MTNVLSPSLLLDTCAVIWIANGDQIGEAALRAIAEAERDGRVFVSTVSAWEIGLLSQPRSSRQPIINFMPDPKTWFSRFMGRPPIKEARLTADIAIDASHLPGNLHGDPADRLIIATARKLALPLVTRDRKILAYGQAGFVDVIAC